MSGIRKLAAWRGIAAIAVIAGAALTVVPTDADDKKFTAADVLGWEETSQNSFFETSVSMAGVIAIQSENPAGRCINDWYFKTDAGKQSANQEIRKAMTRFSDFYPASVIVAVLEKNCGELTPTN
ncbi:MAG: hypothetical protein AAGK00_00610 [Pseudomonadota bacterium]